MLRPFLDATEILRALGFPRLVSVDNFRSPNFPLMAEILQWIVAKFDPNTRIPSNIDSEADRVIFVKSCVLLLLQNARVRLNPKNLYQSDGHAVRELLGVLRILYRATLEQKQQRKSDYAIQLSALRAQINAKRQEIRRSMQLASKLPSIGANIYDLLAREVFAKESRSRALSEMLNAGEVEREVRAMIEAAERRAADAQYKLANLAADEQDLERKIERRKRECDQLQKRLVKLQSFRPPYMDEYERLEAQLKELYAVYVLLFRNLSHLQQQLWEVERAERDRHANAEQTMRVAVDRMRMENNEMALGGGGEKLSTTIAGINLGGDNLPVGKEVKVVGNMVGAGLSEDEDDDDDDSQDYGGGDVVLVNRKAMAAVKARQDAVDDDDERDSDDGDDESALLLRNANFSIDEPLAHSFAAGNGGGRRFNTTIMDDVTNAGDRQDDDEEFMRSRLDVIDENEDDENYQNNNSDDDF